MSVYKKYYHIGGITIELLSELPITDNTFHPKFSAFETTKPSLDKMVIEHHFGWEEDTLDTVDDDKFFINKTWKIITRDDQIIYKWINPYPPHNSILRKAIADKGHTHITIYNDDYLKNKYLEGNLLSLSMFPTDQILIGAHLGYKQGCTLHSLGIIMDASGFLFIGHSEAGKSTMATIVQKNAEILCDDRNIIRKTSDGYQLYGTWSHGDIQDISPNSCQLKAIFFLEKSFTNAIEPITDKKTLISKLIACLIRPITTSDWWNNSLDLLNDLSESVPVYNLKFNKDPEIINLIKRSGNKRDKR
jgi:hypothetical protein